MRFSVIAAREGDTASGPPIAIRLFDHTSVHFVSHHPDRTNHGWSLAWLSGKRRNAEERRRAITTTFRASALWTLSRT